MLNLILPALYIAPLLAVLFLERKKTTEALLWVPVMCDFIANLTTPRRMFLPLVAAGGKVIRIQSPTPTRSSCTGAARKNLPGAYFCPLHL